MKLHLLDATYELFRAFFAMPSERAPDGREVGAIRGLIGSTLALLREPGVTHVGAATDHVIESFRNQLFAGYKTGEGVPPELLAQFPLAEDALRALGVVVWPMVEFEADDALADRRGALRGSGRAGGDPVARQGSLPVRARHARGDARPPPRQDLRRRRGAGEVRRAAGVDPRSARPRRRHRGRHPRHSGLRDEDRGGGAAGVRNDRAAFPTTRRAGRVKLRGADRLAATLATRRADALLYKRLATLRTDVPLRESLADLEWRGVRRAEFQRLCQQLGFGNLAAAADAWATRQTERP